MASLEKYADRLYFVFFLPNMHKLCAYSCHRRYSNRILYIRKAGEFSVFKWTLKFYRSEYASPFTGKPPPACFDRFEVLRTAAIYGRFTR